MDDRTMMFSAISDLHLARSTPPNIVPNVGPIHDGFRQTIYGGSWNKRDFKNLNKKIKNIGSEFLIVGGDMSAYRKLGTKRTIEWLLTNLEIPAFFQVGDHDADGIGEWEKGYNQPKNFYYLRDNILFIFVMAGNQIHGPSSLTSLQEIWLKYLLLTKYPDKLAFLITHPPISVGYDEGVEMVGEVTGGKGVADSGKFWENIIKQRNGHTINLYGHQHKMWEEDGSFRKFKNHTSVALESNFLDVGNRNSLCISNIKVNESDVEVSRYNLDKEETVSTDIVKLDTQLNEKTGDEIGEPYWLINNKDITHHNHFAGDREFEIVGIDSSQSNVIPDPGFSSIDGFPPRPWWYSNINYSQIRLLPPSKFSGERRTLSLKVDHPPKKFQFNTNPNNQKTGTITRDILIFDPIKEPPGSPSTKWEFSVSMKSKEDTNKPISIILQCLNIDWNYPVDPKLPIPKILASPEVKAVTNSGEKLLRNFIKSIISSRTVEILSEEDNELDVKGNSFTQYTITGETPARTNVIRPVIKFHEKGEYYIQNPILRPAPNGSATANPSFKVNEKDFSYEGSLNHLTNKCISVPVQTGEENIQVSVDGSRIGLFQVMYKNPEYWFYGTTYNKEGKKYVPDTECSPFDVRLIMELDS